MFNSRWQFVSDGSDIGFGIYMKTKIDVKQKITEMREMLPTTRYNAHLVPEDGSYACEEPGICKYRLCQYLLFYNHLSSLCVTFLIRYMFRTTLFTYFRGLITLL